MYSRLGGRLSIRLRQCTQYAVPATTKRSNSQLYIYYTQNKSKKYRYFGQLGRVSKYPRNIDRAWHGSLYIIEWARKTTDRYKLMLVYCNSLYASHTTYNKGYHSIESRKEEDQDGFLKSELIVFMQMVTIKMGNTSRRHVTANTYLSKNSMLVSIRKQKICSYIHT